LVFPFLMSNQISGAGIEQSGSGYNSVTNRLQATSAWSGSDFASKETVDFTASDCCCRTE
jgi:hypothetical protein